MLLWFKLRLNVIVIWDFSSSDLSISIERIVGFPSKDQSMDSFAVLSNTNSIWGCDASVSQR